MFRENMLFVQINSVWIGYIKKTCLLEEEMSDAECGDINTMTTDSPKNIQMNQGNIRIHVSSYYWLY